MEVLAESRQALPNVVWIEAAHRSRQGFETFRGRPLGDGLVAEVEGIDSSSVQVVLRGANNEELASSGGTFVDGRLHLAIPWGKDRFSLQVVDREGESLSDVRVVVEDPQRPDSLWYGSTNASGECELSGVPPHTVLVHLQHGSAGSHFGLECDASDRSAEVVLDGEGKLELDFLDGTTLLPGVSCAFVDTLGRSLFWESTSDDSGRVAIADLALDSYRMKAWKSDCWTVEFEATAHVDGGPTQIQVRRLGDLQLELLASGGLPVSGMRVHLESAEFGIDVAEWVAAGRVASGDLVTDLHGQILVQGLPRGLYRWRVELEDGPLEGELEVEALEKSEVRLMLP